MTFYSFTYFDKWCVKHFNIITLKLIFDLFLVRLWANQGLLAI